MTLREWMQENKPDEVDSEYGGGVAYCPSDYEELVGHYDYYLCESICKHRISYEDFESCDVCWSMKYETKLKG